VKRVLGYAVFAVVVYVVFLLTTFPADRAYALLKGRLPPQVQLYGLEGSVWHGRAQVAQLGRYRVAPLSWQYRPLALLTGRVAVKVAMERGAGRASAVVGLSRGGNVRLTDVDVALPADEVVDLLRLPVIQVNGAVNARLDSLLLQAGHVTAVDGTLSWDQAQVIRPQPLQLGGLEAKFDTKDGAVKGTLRDKGGPLLVDGIVTLKGDGSYQVNANVGTRDNTQPALNRIINSMGRQGPGGKVQVNYIGRMPPLAATF
jgi:general secretion pathway protein N